MRSKQSGISEAKGRWSSKKKMDAVVRLLKGEDLDSLSRELRVNAATLSSWREVFLAKPLAGLKSRKVDAREMRSEDPIIRRRDRIPTITLQCDIQDGLQPPQVTAEIQNALKPIVAKLPAGYHVEIGGNTEESNKANDALAPVFPAMILLTLFVLVIQTRSMSGMALVFLTAPLGLIGTVPALLLFGQPFGFNAILGVIGLAGILMRNTLILVDQIHENQTQGLTPYHAVVEATVQRARPVVLTALAAVLAFIELTSSVFWGSMAYVLVGGTAIGTVLILVFLPALYSIWYRVERSPDDPGAQVVSPRTEIPERSPHTGGHQMPAAP